MTTNRLNRLRGGALPVKDIKHFLYKSYSVDGPSDYGDYLVDHSIVLYFHDDKGELLDVCTQSMKPSDIVERIKVGMQAS